MHNLFGDTTAAHISVKDCTYHIDQIIDGETVDEVLEYVQYNPKKLVRQLEQWVTKSVRQGKITLEEAQGIPVELPLRTLRLHISRRVKSLWNSVPVPIL